MLAFSSMLTAETKNANSRIRTPTCIFKDQVLDSFKKKGGGGGCKESDVTSKRGFMGK